MFPNIAQLLEPLIPHFVSGRDVAIKSVSAICERLDKIEDAVSNPDVIQTTIQFPVNLALNGTTTLRVPVGETWELGAVSGRGNTQAAELVARDVTGVFLFGFTLNNQSSAVFGGSGMRMPQGTEIVLTALFSGIEARIQFNAYRPAPKVKGRFAGTFEREIDYEYSWSQEGMTERHFSGTALPHSTDNHKVSDPLLPSELEH